jgi:hypothetical protein
VEGGFHGGGAAAPSTHAPPAKDQPGANKITKVMYSAEPKQISTQKKKSHRIAFQSRFPKAQKDVTLCWRSIIAIRAHHHFNGQASMCCE